MTKYIFVFGLSLLLSGCSPGPQRMYSGPQLEPDKEITIKTQDKVGDRELRIVLVDGEETIGFWKRLFSGWATEVRVLPGKHKIRLVYKNSLMYSVGEVWIAACPRKFYIAKAQATGYVTEMWIEDKETGKRVGGKNSNENEPMSMNAACDQHAEDLLSRVTSHIP